MQLAHAVYDQARALIARRLGLDFAEARRANLEWGFLSACRAAAMPTPERYLTWLTTLPAESQMWQQLASYLTVGETYFFRDAASLAALEYHLLPSLIAARRAEHNLSLRLWSAGCATGEEPYSLAMLLDRLLPDRSQWQVTLLATDINPKALEVAQRGLYRSWSFRATPMWLREQYFCCRSAGLFALQPRIRRMVTFARCNLADAAALTAVANTNAMDVILCRNVLMYFTSEAQRTTVAQLQRALTPGGWLIVAAVEASAALLQPLVPITFPGAILYRKAPTAVDVLSGSCSRLSAGEAGPAAEGALHTDAGPISHALSHGARAWAGSSPHHSDQSRVIPQASDRSQPAGPTRDEPTPSTLLQRARALADQGCLDQARALCEAVLAQDRLDATAYLLLAAIHHEQGESREALEALRRAIYLAPNCAPAHFLLGSLLLRQGEEQRGRRSLETVIHLLRPVPCDEMVPSSDGLTAGRLLEMARASLETR